MSDDEGLNDAEELSVSGLRANYRARMDEPRMSDERLAEIREVLRHTIGWGWRTTASALDELLREVEATRSDAALGATLRESWGEVPRSEELHISPTAEGPWVYIGYSHESEATRRLSALLAERREGRDG